MLVGRNQFDSVYAMVKEAAAQGNACSVIIFVAADCDAACACRTLTTLLKSDNVTHKVRLVVGDCGGWTRCVVQVQPVSGYDDVRRVSEGCVSSLLDSLLDSSLDAARSLEGGEVRSVVLLNCGASVDLADMVLEHAPRANVFVVDYHRPVHLKNVHSQRVLVLQAEDDGGAPSDTEDDGSTSSDEEDVADEVDDEDEADEADDEGLASKRPRRSGDAERERRRERRRRVRAYYDGVYDGTPSALVLFSMCDALSRATTTELWLAAVGLSSLHDHWRISDENYDALVAFLETCLRELDATRRRLFRDRNDRSEQPDSGLVETGTVSFERHEPRFMLHRHWGLLWSMYYSNFVASRLSVWRKDGTSKLYELLAKIGLSIEQSQQRWSFLAPSMRRKLRENLPKYAAEYQLDEPFRAAFLRVTGCGGEAVAAPDAARCVEALLEAPLAKAAFEGDAANASSDATFARERAAWLAGFWRAYDVALPDDDDLFATAVEAAIALQKAVVAVAVQMIDKREIVTLKHFRYVYLSASQTSNRVLTQPLALRKLALFLLGVHRRNGKWTGDKARPLVILAERPGSWLVIGLMHSGGRKNTFGTSFRLAADHIKVNVCHDWFDAAVMEIDQADVQRFVESLHYICSVSG